MADSVMPMDQISHSVRVRFAPSPTGDPHIGNMRTWLLAYLFAKSQNGTTVLRIEDTDKERTVKGSVERIIDSLNWIGIGFDEGPILQSERLDLYRQYAEQLVKKGAAYRCFCRPERLEALRQEQRKKKEPPRYDGLCRKLSPAEANQRFTAGESSVIRLKVPHGENISFVDEIFGQITFESKHIDDQVLLKSDGFPTYHLAVVVDDYEMRISHVIRSDEWLSSTPKHVLLYRAFGWPLPRFIHLPMVLGPDRTKLSKRHGAKSINQYREEGYLPEALLNFIALLGWAPGQDREIMSLEEMVKIFSLDQINKAGAVFDPVKLDHFNGLYIRRLPIDKLADHLLFWVSAKSPVRDWAADRCYFERALKTVQERMVTLADAEPMLVFYFKDPEYSKELLWPVNQKGDATDDSRIREVLEASLASLALLDSWTQKDLETNLRQLAASRQWPAGLVLWPIRVALTGLDKSPGTFEVLEVLGRERSLKRIEKAISKLI